MAVALTYPLDLIHSRLAYAYSMQALRSSTIADVIVSIYRNGGQPSFFAYYQGLTSTLIGMVPYAGTSFCVFESLKSLISDSQTTPLTNFLFGMVAGACAQTVAYPLDVVRRRVQIHPITAHLHSDDYSKGWMRAFKHISASSGLRRGLFAGLSINYIKTAPATGISFTVYEFIRKSCCQCSPED